MEQQQRRDEMDNKMRAIVGKIFERYTLDRTGGWQHERRLVKDVAKGKVLYERLYDPTEGTIVEMEVEVHEITVKQWKEWAGRIEN